jgi:hypothetical protein
VLSAMFPSVATIKSDFFSIKWEKSEFYAQDPAFSIVRVFCMASNLGSSRATDILK